MQRTINHTGRRKIETNELQISMQQQDKHPPEFDVDFSLDKNKLPGNASIYIEAYQRNTLQRFYFGTVNQVVKPEIRVLDKLDLTSQMLFRIRIVDESDCVGRLVASADSLRPADDEQQRSSILPIRSKPLGEQTWKVVFETGGKPELYINSRIPSATNQLKTNPDFQSLIFPAALRQILMFFLWNDDEGDSASNEWFRFAEEIAFERPADDDPLSLMNWVDDVVERFSLRFELCSLLVGRLEGVNDGSS